MAKQDIITQLITTLTNLDASVVRCSEGDKRWAAKEAKSLVWGSDLEEPEKEQVFLTIGRSANPSGWHATGTGIASGIEALKALTPDAEQAPAFNLRNLKNLVSDGAIFSVEFIKRTDGSTRKMVCRLGVRKHLKGGGTHYNASQRNLLTVFDMENKGYRSIPAESIKRLIVGGQTFNFAEV